MLRLAIARTLAVLVFVPLALGANFSPSIVASDEAARSVTGYVESILYRFPAKKHGAEPSELSADGSGALYGTTAEGGVQPDGYGTVFKLTPRRGRADQAMESRWAGLTPSPAGYTQTVLYRFRSGNDGAYPFAGVTVDATGSMYGTTDLGGRSGNGTAFKLTPAGTGYSETVIYNFTGGSDGGQPGSGLIADAAGALFGTTQAGGNGRCAGGCGAVFKLTPSGLL